MSNGLTNNTLSPDTKPVEVLKLPDLFPNIPFPLRENPHTKSVSAESDVWMVEHAKFNEKQLRRFNKLDAGLLVGMCYPDCEPFELRVCNDFMSFLFIVDDWTDEFDTTGTHTMADCVMNTLYHPFTYKSDATASKITKLYVSLHVSQSFSCRSFF